MDDFDKALEKHVVERGWFGEAPSKVTTPLGRARDLAIAAGVIALVIGWNVPISGLVLIGGGIVVGGIVILLFAQGDAGGDDARRDDPGDARGLPADTREDDGAGAVDAAGRR